MMVLRMFAFLVMLFCLVASFYRGQFDGVSVIGLAAFVVFLATFRVLFTRSFWGLDGGVYPLLSLECQGRQHEACGSNGGCRNCGCHQAARVERAA